MFDIKSPQEHPSAMPNITATPELVPSFLNLNDSEICPNFLFHLNEESLRFIKRSIANVDD